MRPIELNLEGFTSFRQEIKINFTDLDLFAITGATGAGKSSLLDAMTYALYGTTTRTGKQISDFVSQGANNLKVQLHFSVANNQYRITRRCRLRTGTPENKVLLETWQNNNWENLGTSITAVQKTLEEIIGMDFDTFTRVIVLPQGKFDEFLKGDTAKRREILRQLAGFEIFERMRKQAGEMTKLFKQEREMVERQLMEIDAPAPLEIEEKSTQLAAYQQQLPTLNQAVVTAQKTLDEEENLLTQLSRLIQLKKDLENLNANNSEIAVLQARLEKLIAANNLQADWALVREARSSFETAETGVKNATISLNIARANLNTEQQQLEKVRKENEVLAPQLKAREEALAGAKIYEEQRAQYGKEVINAEKTLREKSRQLESAQTELTTAENKVKVAHRQVSEATASLEQYKAGGERLKSLEKIAPLLIQLQEIDSQVKNEQNQLIKANKDKEAGAQNYQQLQLKLRDLEASLQQAREALEAGEKANAEAAKLNHAAALRVQLQAGDLCPVCGGIHPENERLPELPASSVLDLVPVRAQLNTAQKAFQNCQIETTKAESTLEALKSLSQQLSQNLTATQQRLNAVQLEINTILGEENWLPLTLKQELQSLQTSDKAYRDTQQQLEKASTQLQVAQQALQYSQETLAKIQTEYQQSLAELEHRQQQLKSCEAKLFEITNNQPYQTLLQTLQQDKQKLATQLKEAENAYQSAHNQAILMEERAKQATGNLEQATAKIQQLEAGWQAKLTSVNFTEETFIFAVEDIKKQAEWERLIQQHREAKIKLETKITDLTETIGEEKAKQTSLAELNQRIQQHKTAKRNAEEQVQQTQKQIAEITAFLQIAQQKQQQTERLIEQQTSLQEREETYHTLAQNLKSNEFQAYILEHLEDELVKRATILLEELTEQRYALKTQEGEYWVQDNWNGGELRRVRTLSGGETFATSLSMALALSEKLAQGSQLGSLFLDEGFGTLDAETLESVTQILESLRQQSRLIGVITHIRPLAERLPAQIKVNKTPQGSHIKIEVQ
ncbi:SMC family ATPase [Ancylothrix sp. C2]|uniref:AAA family ATPase n=1 Tax=Ancylothrix sp. D3o TaxID=2953691 RepID=UPI0021BABBD4|nr:SMC family ATPase [Ancylothrix sp. D3o]MCT7949973.1 SMC family ATPase [Ancylothrix sp. D3o]